MSSITPCGEALMRGVPREVQTLNASKSIHLTGVAIDSVMAELS